MKIGKYFRRGIALLTAVMLCLTGICLAETGTVPQVTEKAAEENTAEPETGKTVKSNAAAIVLLGAGAILLMFSAAFFITSQKKIRQLMKTDRAGISPTDRK